MRDTGYGFCRTLEGTSIDAVRGRVELALRQVGFGILSEIDVRDTLKRKLDVDFRPYVILGACNPTLARQALLAEPMIGLLLPCNVVLSEEADGRIEIGFSNPLAIFELIDKPELATIAAEADARLRQALQDL